MELCDISGQSPSGILSPAEEVKECEQEQKKLEQTAKVCYGELLMNLDLIKVRLIV